MGGMVDFWQATCTAYTHTHPCHDTSAHTTHRFLLKFIPALYRFQMGEAAFCLVGPDGKKMRNLICGIFLKTHA